MKGNFEREELQAPLAEINMTPLVDVMLVLLVIFLITAPMLTSAINLNLPSEAATQITEEEFLAISITKSGQYYLGESAINFDDLEKKLASAAKNNSKQQLRLHADVEVSYGAVSKVLASAQRLGLSNIAFITKK